MFGIVHFILGLALGKYITNIPLLAIIAIASHYMIDAIPHYNPKIPKTKEDYKKIQTYICLIEVLLAITIIKMLPNIPSLTTMYLGAFFSTLPDNISILVYLINKKFDSHFNFPHPHIELKKGLHMQIAITALAIIILIM